MGGGEGGTNVLNEQYVKDLRHAAVITRPSLHGKQAGDYLTIFFGFVTDRCADRTLLKG